MTCASKWMARGRSKTWPARSITHVDSPAAPARFAATAPTGPQPTISRSNTQTRVASLDVQQAIERVARAELSPEKLCWVEPDEIPVCGRRFSDSAPVERDVSVRDRPSAVPERESVE